MTEKRLDKTASARSAPESDYQRPIVSEALSLLDTSGRKPQAADGSLASSTKSKDSSPSSDFLDFGDSASLYGSTAAADQDPVGKGGGDRRNNAKKAEKSETKERPEDGSHTDGWKTKPAFRAERQKLDKFANGLSKVDREEFNKNLNDFERRAAEQKLPDSEVTESYRQLARLVGPEKGTMKLEDRQKMARHMATHLGQTNRFDQGAHETCNVTTLAERTVTDNPSKACEILATASLTGQWIASDNKVITLTPESLKPGFDEGLNGVYDRKRTLATQVLNVVMANDAAQRREPPQFYSQETPTDPTDNGDRLRYKDGTEVMARTQVATKDASGKETYSYVQKPARGPEIHDYEIAAIGERLTGDKNFVIANQARRNTDPRVTSVKSEAEFGESLKKLKDSGELPGIVVVDAAHPLFERPSRAPRQWHVVSVTDYDEATGMVTMSNQWGRASDKKVKLSDLYATTTEYKEPTPPASPAQPKVVLK